MTELYSAILNPSGPNFELWNQVLGSHRVPLESAQSKRMDFPEEVNVEVFMLNLKGLTLRQRAKLTYHLAQKFGAPVYEIERKIIQSGLPIRAADVIVNFPVEVAL